MARPRLAVFKFASCDGCQLTLLDLEDELLAITDAIEVAHFAEASSRLSAGPYDLGLVEGSITTADDADRIREVRAQCRVLVAIGACATAGGIQALRNLSGAGDFASVVYPNPEFISVLDRSTPISDHVAVDYELRGCPISKAQLLEMVGAFLHGRRPALPTHSVCMECKARGAPCVMVAAGTPCLGPVTQAGCGAICPAFDRGCYGCFGPMESPNIDALAERWDVLGAGGRELVDALSTFNVAAEAFGEARERHG